ncbi:MAG TPA: DUF6485 family protein [Candidatus Cloacimonadota bacterium]|nr:DUF6485 family protein [Candidatus Cloacimonadota bacterium]
MSCENQKRNAMKCNCTYSCNNHGICCECVSYHRSRRELPACFFPQEAERNYDRSFRHFVELHQKGKI